MQTTLKIDHHKDDIVEVITKPKYNPTIPKFKRIGFPMTHTTTDILDLLGEKYYSNPSVTWFLWKLVKNTNTTSNIAILRNNTLTPAEIRRVVAAYSTLNQDNIIIRIKREHYIINPRIFLPKNETYNEVLEHWLSLGGK